MICLDANYLIGGVSEHRPEFEHIVVWSAAGESFCTASPAWYEFLCGPVTREQIDAMRTCLSGGILPFDESNADTAAYLFNALNRPRSRRVDIMIAATAINQKIPLATRNRAHFDALVPYGLALIDPSG